jgi:hypothetical protein
MAKDSAIENLTFKMIANFPSLLRLPFFFKLEYIKEVHGIRHCCILTFIHLVQQVSQLLAHLLEVIQRAASLLQTIN